VTGMRDNGETTYSLGYESSSNIHLIAAAPKMYRALKHLHDTMINSTPKIKLHDGAVLSADLIGELLAEARGEKREAMKKIKLPIDLTKSEIEDLHKACFTPFQETNGGGWYSFLLGSEPTEKLDKAGMILGSKWRYDAKAGQFFMIRILNRDNGRRVSEWRKRLLEVRMEMAGAQ